MRGSPLIRALVVFVALLALAPLLWRMTQPAAATRAVPQPVAPAVGTKAVTMELTFTSQPKRVSVMHLQREVWAKDMPAAEEKADLSLAWPQEGVDLRFKVDWAEGIRAAMLVRITQPDGAEQAQTVWSADEVLTFK